MDLITYATGFAQNLQSAKPTQYLTSIPVEKWRSPISLNLIREDLLRYQHPVKRFHDPKLEDSIKAAYRAFHLDERVYPVHLNDNLNRPHVTDSSGPGLPWSQYGYKTKGQVKQDPSAQRGIRYYWHRLKCGKQMSPPHCSAFARSHISDYPEFKCRLVWGYPYTILAQEQCFAEPLLEAYKKSNCPIAYGYEMVKGGMHKINARFGSADYIYCVDFKSFDKTVPAWLIHEAFDILKTNMNFSRYQHSGVPITPCLYKVWDSLVDYFINTPIRLANGEVYRKCSGIPSGSSFTQLVGSIVNYIVLDYAKRSCGAPFDDLLVFGDDSIGSACDEHSLVQLQTSFLKFGMTINQKKSKVTRYISDITFLGFSNIDRSPTKPTIDWLASLAYPERSDRSFDDFATRALGLLYANSGVDCRVDTMLRDIVDCPFDISLSNSARRYLRSLGITSLLKKPPDRLTLFNKVTFNI